MIELVLPLLAIPVFCGLAKWRSGMLLCLSTAILQDPLRKLTPDQPVYFVAFVALAFAGAVLGALARGISLTPANVLRQHRQLAAPFSILMLLIIVQAFNSYLRFDNVLITLAGVATYLLPFPAIAFAYQLTSREGEFRIVQFMKWYIVCISLALTTIYFEFSGYDWPVLGQVGPKFIIFDRWTGAVLISFSGIFRASEIAAWHAMTAACFVVVLTFLRRTTLARLVSAAVVVALLIGIGIVTGRRKIVIEFAVFVSTYFILWIVLEKRAGKLAFVASTAAALGLYAWLAGELRENVAQRTGVEMSNYSLYVQRSETVFRDAPARFVELGIAPVTWAYDSFGLFGAGLGTGTQGTEYFGGGAAIAGAAEGGLGKITLELGIPGLFVMGWLAVSLFRRLWQSMRAASRRSLRIGRLSFGFFSFLVANLAGFSVATQAYGDFFILLILGWALGFLLAVPLLLEREARIEQLRLAESVHAVPA